ncbi:hypothetical protein AAEX37_01251 [Oligella sp. MSHR50489EDL]
MKLEALLDKIFYTLTFAAALACGIPAVYSIFLAFYYYFSGQYDVSLLTVFVTSFMLVAYWGGSFFFMLWFCGRITI